MINVFKENGRVGHENGLRFHEQDMVKLKYRFHNDIEVKMKIDYCRAGFGLVFERPVALTSTGRDAFLFKLGYDTFSVFRRQFEGQERLIYRSCKFAPLLKDVEVVFRKVGSEIIVESEGERLGSYKLPRALESFDVHIYSNEGNVVKNIAIKNNVPASWVTNVKNANGGRIEFTKHQVLFENCEQDGEIEQHDIKLKPGKYYVNCNLVSGSAEFYVFYSDDKRYDDAEKNILSLDGHFEVEKEIPVTLKIKAKNAKIESISIQEEKDGIFVPTDGAAKSKEGSHLSLSLDYIEEARWTATLERKQEDQNLYLLETTVKKYLLSDGFVRAGKTYDFVFSVTDMKLTVIEEGEIIKEILVAASPDEEFVTLFRNTNTSIRNLIVRKTNGEEVDIVLQKTIKTFIPASVSGPIIVTGKDEEPLNLSSSYRSYEEDGMLHYEFTNWEREYFYSNEQARLTEKARGESGDFRLYGIKTGDQEVDWANILHIEKGLDSIHHFVKRYDVIEESLYGYDETLNAIEMDISVLETYDLFVIDYLKADSYSVNLKEEYGVYEVDISTKEENVTMHYEGTSNDGTVSSYINTGIVANNRNVYVVLREGQE